MGGPLGTHGSFRKLGVPYFVVLIIRILLFRVPYWYYILLPYCTFENSHRTCVSLLVAKQVLHYSLQRGFSLRETVPDPTGSELDQYSCQLQRLHRDLLPQRMTLKRPPSYDGTTRCAKTCLIGLAQYWRALREHFVKGTSRHIPCVFASSLYSTV